MNESFDLFEPAKFLPATVGEVGNRTFLLQAIEGSQIVTLKVEKEQLRAMAKYVADLLADGPRPGHLPEDDELELTEPAEPAWAVGPISINYDEDDDRFLVVCEQATYDEELADLDAPAAVATFRITREQLAAFIIRATTLVDAGRPPCPLCGYPLDARGHTCPRTNGHSQPRL